MGVNTACKTDDVGSVGFTSDGRESVHNLGSTDSYVCFPLPSSGCRGRPLREPCGSPPSSVLWSCKTAQPSFRASSGRPLVARTSRPNPGAVLLVWEEMGSSREFPANLCGTCPGLGTPPIPARPRISGRCRMLPSAALNTSASELRNDFGAESSRPVSLLSTLRTHQSPGEWQDSLLVCLLDFDQAGVAPARLEQEVSLTHC